MTPRERVEAILRGRPADRVPFTMYANKLPRCQVELELRNAGLCILERGPGVFEAVSPNVKTSWISYDEKGAHYVKAFIETPRGLLTTIERPGIGTTWRVKRMFTGPDDYAAVISMVRDRQYVPSYDGFVRARERYGEGSFLRPGIGYSPLQEIIYTVMGVEQFSIEWAERRDDLMKLYDALTEDRRKIYPILADSPAVAFNYGGNVSPEVVGKERFEKYIVPHYDEAAEVLHRKGKLMGVHLDANNKLLAPGVARSLMDYVEAFTPPPDCDMSVAEALAAWPGKVLWINFPSSVHLMGVATVEETTRQILREAAPGDRFIMGVTEDVHDDAWPRTFPAIARIINEEGRLPLRG